MNISAKEIKEGQRKLSKINEDFLEFAENNPEALKASTFKSLDLNDELFTLQPWPTFVSRGNIKEFQEAAVKLFDIIKTLPQRLFNNDIKKISAYFKIPEEAVKIQLDGYTGENIQHLVSRGDFILASSGLKCLEYNVTASLGGWYLPLWEALYQNHPLVNRFLKQQGIKLRNGNLIQRFLEHAIHGLSREIPLENGELNVLFAVLKDAHYRAPIRIYLDNIYKQVLLAEDPSLRGWIFIADYHHLEAVDNQIYFKGKKIHAVIEMRNGVVSPQVLEAFKAGNIRLINGPITDLLSSKLALVLLSDYGAAKNVFSEEEKRLIDKYIPWTRKVVAGRTRFGQATIKMPGFLLAHKDKFVLKSSIGYGGKEVFIGKRTPGEKWKELIDTAIIEEDWLVQEFVDSSPGIYQVGENGCDWHDMVWGFFVLGSQYAGAWVRVLPQKDNKGVINCHQGATISIIFEVED